MIYEIIVTLNHPQLMYILLSLIKHLCTLHLSFHFPFFFVFCCLSILILSSKNPETQVTSLLQIHHALPSVISVT